MRYCPGIHLVRLKKTIDNLSELLAEQSYLSNISQLAFTCRQICTPISETVFVVCGGYLYYPSNMMGYNHVLSFSCILFSSLVHCIIIPLFLLPFLFKLKLLPHLSFSVLLSISYHQHFLLFLPFIYSPCYHSYLLSNTGRR